METVSVLAFVCKGVRKLRRSSVKISGILSEIRTERVIKRIERYRHANSFRENLFSFIFLLIGIKSRNIKSDGSVK
jgi:hypothetical protein